MNQTVFARMTGYVTRLARETAAIRLRRNSFEQNYELLAKGQENN
jgi:hypothetical protein